MPYEIIATLGPSSASETVWNAMIPAGVTGFRLNTSHTSLDQIFEWVDRLITFCSTINPAPFLVLDLQGSKWRLGSFPVNTFFNGQRIELILSDHTSDAGVLPVPHLDFFRAAPVSNKEIVLNDAKVRLLIEETFPDRLAAVVIQPGELSSNKGITFASSSYRQESLSSKDMEIIRRTRDLPLIRYAISYVKDAAEMARYHQDAGSTVQMIAKIERPCAVKEASKIARHAQILWLCRGDLGAEMGLPEMAKNIFSFSQQVLRLPVPVLLAGQVLEHMTASPHPTRSEVYCMYEALKQGYAGFVLSDETAIGQDPVASCQAAALFMNTSYTS